MEVESNKLWLKLTTLSLLPLFFIMPAFSARVKKSILKKKKQLSKRGNSFQPMDEANRAMCYALRNPPKGTKKTKFKDIRLVVRKKDGKPPSIPGIQKAALAFKQEKQKKGRKLGWRKTTKEEDKKLMQTFHKLRPPGHGVDSRVVHSALPQKLKKKIGRKTVIRRLGKRGYTAQKKLSKSDPGVQGKAKRIAFGRKCEDKSAEYWKGHLQAVGDIKEFTYYPKELKPTFKKLRASWTYMSKRERKKSDFQRPKRWFKKKDWKKTKKQKVFGMTTSNWKMLAFLVPKPWSAEQWAVEIKTKVKPFLKKAFRGKNSFRILLDGEKLLVAPPAKAALNAARISVMDGWPKYSPDLNPQEHVGSKAEPRLRVLEKDNDTFEAWQQKVLKAVLQYPAPEKLVGSMARRIKTLLERSGAMLDD